MYISFPTICILTKVAMWQKLKPWGPELLDKQILCWKQLSFDASSHPSCLTYYEERAPFILVSLISYKKQTFCGKNGMTSLNLKATVCTLPLCCFFSRRGSFIGSVIIKSFIWDVSQISSPSGSLPFSSSYSWFKPIDSCRDDDRGTTSSGGTYLSIKIDTATMVNDRSVPTLTWNGQAFKFLFHVK